MAGNPLCGLRQFAARSTTVATRSCSRRFLGLQVFERRRLDAWLPVLVQVTHHLGQARGVAALGQIDRDDVGVHVDPVDLASGEHAPSQFVGRGVAPCIVDGTEVLMAHAGQGAIDLETHDSA